MVPMIILREPKPQIFARANPWDALPREVQVDIGKDQALVGETPESYVDGQDQPKINDICDHTPKVLMHPSVRETHHMAMSGNHT